MEQLESQLPAAEVTLTADILDRIDRLVAPGVTINPDDNSYGEAELTRQRYDAPRDVALTWHRRDRLAAFIEAQVATGRKGVRQDR